MAYDASRDACAFHTKTHEHLKKIPRHLLMAISKIESGRLNPNSQQVEAWPWTINVEGKGYYFPTKHEAVKRVKELVAKGIKSIDVGCMQINLHHHKGAFKTIEEAFDPKLNTEYASKFLSSLRETHGSWAQAIAHYHSATPLHHIPYRKKVLDKWREENRTSPITDSYLMPLKSNLSKGFSDPKDAQWHRHAKRSQRPLLTATPNRRLRTTLVRGDRLYNTRQNKTYGHKPIIHIKEKS